MVRMKHRRLAPPRYVLTCSTWHEQVKHGTGFARKKGAGNCAYHFFCWRYGELEERSGGGMMPGQMTARQVNAMAGVNRRRSVNEVSNHGVAQGGSVTPNLVGSAGFEGPFHKCGVAVHAPRPRTQVAKRRGRGLAVQRQAHTATSGFKHSRNPSVVHLDSSWPCLLQGSVSNRVFGDNHRTAGAKIKAMDGEKFRFRFKFPLRGKTPKSGNQGVGPFPVGGHPRGFQHHTVVDVVMQHLQNQIHVANFVWKNSAVILDKSTFGAA